MKYLFRVIPRLASNHVRAVTVMFAFGNLVDACGSNHVRGAMPDFKIRRMHVWTRLVSNLPSLGTGNQPGEVYGGSAKQMHSIGQRCRCLCVKIPG